MLLWCKNLPVLLWGPVRPNMPKSASKFIFVPECTYVVNLMKFPKAVCNKSCSHTFNIGLWTRVHPVNGMPLDRYITLFV